MKVKCKDILDIEVYLYLHCTKLQPGSTIQGKLQKQNTFTRPGVPNNTRYSNNLKCVNGSLMAAWHLIKNGLYHETNVQSSIIFKFTINKNLATPLYLALGQGYFNFWWNNDNHTPMPSIHWAGYLGIHFNKLNMPEAVLVLHAIIMAGSQLLCILNHTIIG